MRWIAVPGSNGSPQCPHRPGYWAGIQRPVLRSWARSVRFSSVGVGMLRQWSAMGLSEVLQELAKPDELFGAAVVEEPRRPVVVCEREVPVMPDVYVETGAVAVFYDDAVAG